MTLQEKIEQCSSFLFFKSHDIQKSPDMCGLLFDNPLVGREAFEEILASTEKSFIRVTFYLLGSTLRLIINGIKNDLIVTVNNLSISDSDLLELKGAYSSHPHYSFGFGIFENANGQIAIYPITQQEVVLTIKSWEIVEY